LNGSANTASGIPILNQQRRWVKVGEFMDATGVVVERTSRERKGKGVGGVEHMERV